MISKTVIKSIILLILTSIFVTACSEPKPVEGFVTKLKWERVRCLDCLRDGRREGAFLPKDAKLIRTGKLANGEPRYYYTQKIWLDKGCFNSFGLGEELHWNKQAENLPEDERVQGESTKYYALCSFSNGKDQWEEISFDQWKAFHEKDLGNVKVSGMYHINFASGITFH